MGLYYNGKKVRNLYYNGKCITLLALGKEMTRLVEGDDFVRAQWLVGDDIAYIKGITFDLWNNHFNTRIGKNERSQYFHYYVQSTATNFQVRVDTNVSIPYLATIFRNAENGIHIADISPYSSMPNVVDFDFYIDDSTFYCNRDGVIYTNSGTNIAIESNWTSIQPTIKSAKISYIREVLPDGSYRSNLIPCRLLRPIPASLDGNGIARNAGECGMFDAVSGKFFGNVGSGTFSVEPSLIEGVDYERHKWLKGDGSAYLYLGEVQNYIEFDVDLQQEVASDKFIYGHNGQIRYGYKGQTLSVLSPENQIKYYNVPLQGTIRIDFSTHYAYFNGEQFGHTDLGTEGNDENSFKKAYFFGYEHLPSFRSRYVSLGKVNMDGSNLTPVRLLRPLQSYLDANNKARAQYECGILDLKTMKFYGNVASSGSFTVSDNN